MCDTDLALEALGALLNAKITSSEQRGSSGGETQQPLNINDFIPTLLDAHETCPVSKCHLEIIRRELQDDQPQDVEIPEDIPTTGRHHVINKEEFFDPKYDYDFTNQKDTKTYSRGGEEYKRPCGWYRFGLKVLNKYDGNTWLGSTDRSTQSVDGEWPVSFHGTSKKGAEGIIEGYYKAGQNAKFGRGVYSTPHIDVAVQYAKTFTSSKTGKRYMVILQNRVNPESRKTYNENKYWLIPIPAETSDEEERKMVEGAIRPYGLLLKEKAIPPPQKKSHCKCL